MRRTALLLSAFTLVVSATSLVAQSKPNFSGKWTMVVDPNAPPASGRGGRGGLGAEPTIAQDDKTLTITRTTQAGESKTVYNLDGSDSKNTIAMGGNSVESVSKAKWEGDKLTIVTTTNFNGNSFETTQQFALDATGNLVFQVTAPGRGGGAPTTTTSTYKKG